MSISARQRSRRWAITGFVLTISMEKSVRTRSSSVVGYHKGWKTVSMLSFAWPDAYEKARYCADVIMKKMKKRGMKADDVHISFIGVNSLHLNVADMSEEALKNLNECVMRIAVFSEDKNECAKIIPEISPMS